MLWTLPPEMVGASVLAMLSVVDIVHLDTAWLTKSHRSHWSDSVRFSPPLDLPDNAQDDIFILSWICERNLTLQNIALRDSLLASLNLLSRHPGTLVGGVSVQVLNWSHFLDTCSGPIAKSEQLANKIVQLNLSSCQYEDLPQERMCDPAVFRNLSSLRFATYSAMGILLPFAVSLMHLNPLEKLWAFFSRSAPQEFWTALKMRGPTLTELSLYCQVDEADMRVIAESCVNLTRLNMSDTVMDRGVIMVAAMCKELVDISFGIDLGRGFRPQPPDQITELAIAGIFRGCRNLQSLRFPIAPLTDGGMYCLSRCHCPLQTLCCTWAVASSRFIAACAQDFATLEEIELGGIDEGTGDALAATVRLMPRLKRATLQPVGPLPVSVIAAASEACTELNNFCIEGELQAGCEAPLLALLARNPSLDTLELGYSDEPISGNKILLAIAQHCPAMRSVSLYNALDVTDASITALAQSCSGLLTLTLQTDSEVTDAGLTALAVCCPHLLDVYLLGSQKLTLSGIRHFVLRCQELACLCVPAKIMTLEQAERVKKEAWPRSPLIMRSFATGEELEAQQGAEEDVQVDFEEPAGETGVEAPEGAVDETIGNEA